MPLSEDVRAELAAVAPRKACCRLAELSALVRGAGSVHLRGRGHVSVHLEVATPAVARRAFALLRCYGVPAEIHPYDVTIERGGAAEAYDCKWGARGINADVLHQLDDARTHAADEDETLRVALVVFDARRSCEVRLARQTAPHDATAVVTLESLDQLAGPRP